MFIAGIGGLAKHIAELKRAQGGGGGAVTPKQKPIAPRIDPRGALPMNTMGNNSIARLAKAKRK